MSALASLYQDIILEHQQEPRNFHVIEKADASKEGFNPLCGDRICLQLKLSLDHSKVEQIGFQGEGCTICMASASIMTEELKALDVPIALDRIMSFRRWMQGLGEKPESREDDLEALGGVRKFPVRIKCALLAWTTANQALTEVIMKSEGSKND